jgi:hypothetical protein
MGREIKRRDGRVSYLHTQAKQRVFLATRNPALCLSLSHMTNKQQRKSVMQAVYGLLPSAGFAV